MTVSVVYMRSSTIPRPPAPRERPNRDSGDFERLLEDDKPSSVCPFSFTALSVRPRAQERIHFGKARYLFCVSRTILFVNRYIMSASVKWRSRHCLCVLISEHRVAFAFQCSRPSCMFPVLLCDLLTPDHCLVTASVVYAVMCFCTYSSSIVPRSR